MKKSQFSLTLALLLSFLLLQCQDSDDNESSVQILVFSKTEGFRHQSIEKGVSTLRDLGASNDFGITHSENSSLFTSNNLSEYDLVIFLSTTGDILNNDQQEAFENYIKGGGSFLGIHAATDTEYNWPWYGRMVGAYFDSHPNNPNVRMASLDVINPDHPSTSHLDSKWERRDEWYNFRDINPDIEVLINLDENSYEGGTNGDFHPIAWFHEYDGGRVFYTAGGHTSSSFDEADFQQHLLGGIEYCLNRN